MNASFFVKLSRSIAFSFDICDTDAISKFFPSKPLKFPLTLLITRYITTIVVIINNINIPKITDNITLSRFDFFNFLATIL